MPPRALDPSGLFLIDKPEGPSSFTVVADVRRRTGARTGHAGTLDPFATGLLLVLSGSATKLAQRFVGLDKRYVTDVDLTAVTDSGDREGTVLEHHDPPNDLEPLLDALRGEIELPIPTASAVKVGGERAYKLHRQGVAVEMPVRRSRVDTLDLDLLQRRPRAPRPARQLRDLRARDRDGARGPLQNVAADRGRAVPGRGGRPRAPADRRGGARAAVNVARQVDQLEPKARAVALGTFDGVHLGHRRVLDATLAAGRTPTVVTFDPHPREALGYGVELLVPLARRLELLAEAGIEETLVVDFDLELAQLPPEAFAERILRPLGAEVVLAGSNFRFGRGRAGDLALLEGLGFDARPVPLVDGVSSTRIRDLLRGGEIERAAKLLGRPPEIAGTVVAGDARGGTLGFPTANLRPEPGVLVPGYGIYAGRRGRPARRDLDRHEPALRRRRAPNRGVPARFRGRPLRRAAEARALAAPARRAGVRERGRAGGADRPRRRGDPAGTAAIAAAGSRRQPHLPGMEQRVPIERHELVRCLDCGTEYRLPRDTAQADPCPVCGSVGWIAVDRSGTPDERK